MADVCITDLDVAINKLKEVGKRAIHDAFNKVLERIEKGTKDVKGNQGYAVWISRNREQFQDEYEDLLSRFREKIAKDPDLSKIKEDHYIETIQREVYNTIGDIRTMGNNADMLISVMSKSPDIRAAKGIVGRMFNFFDNSARREEDLFNAREVDLWKHIEEGGTSKNPDDIAKAKLFIRDAQAGGMLLFNHLKDIGKADPHRYMYDSVKAGHSKDSPVLNIIVNVLKQLKEYKEMRLKTDYPGYRQPLTDFSYRLDLAKIFDEDTFVDFMETAIEPHIYLRMSKRQYESLVDLEEVPGGFLRSEIRKQHKELIQPKIDAYNMSGSSAKHNPFLNNYWVFKNQDLEYEMLKRFADLRGGILGSHRNHIKNQLANAGREAVLGRSPQKTFVMMRNILHAKYKDQAKRGVEDFDQMLEPYVEEFRDRYNPKNVVNEDLANIRTAATQIVSASLLGKSATRNTSHDNTTHAAMVYHAYNDTGGITTYLQRSVALWRDVVVGAVKGTASVAKAWATGKSIEPAKLSDTQEELKAWFEEQGLSIDIQMNAALAGVRKSKYDIDPSPEGGGGKWSDFWAGAARNAERLARTVSVMSGADAVNQAARIDAAIKSGGILERFFEKATWNKLDNKDKVLLGNHGVTEPIFNLLKRIKKDKHGIVSLKAFKEIDLKKETSTVETEQQVRKRLEFVYYNLLNGMMDEFAPLPSIQSEVSWARGVKKNTVPGTLMTLMFKFSNIGKSAYINLHRPLRRQAGLDPNVVNADPFNFVPMALQLSKENPMYLGKVMMGSLLGGAMIQWTSELANNEPLSAITPEFMAKALLRTSAIGYMGELINNIYWGSGLMGDTSESVFKSMGSLVGIGEAVAEGDSEKAWQRASSARRSLPVVNVWWTGLILDKAIRDGLDVPYSGYKKQKFDERGRLFDEPIQQWDEVSSYIPGGD